MKRSLVACLVSVAAAATAGNPYGFCYHIGYSKKTDETIRKELALLRSSGAEWIRADISWPWQPRSGKTGDYGFGNFERACRLADEAGLRLLAIINRCPSSAEPLHEHLDGWCAFIRQAVTRFKGRVTHWEIWNEQNFPNERRWGSKDVAIHARNYTKCLKAAFAAVKDSDPDAVVLYGGTSHVPLDFIEATFAAGAGEAFDVMNVHPYDTDGIPEFCLAWNARQLRLLMAKYGLSGKPLWATEIGWSTSPRRSGGIYGRILPEAFGVLGIDTAKVPLTAVEGAWSPLRDHTRHFPQFKCLEVIPGDDIAKLDPKRNPVLLPMSGETFAHHRQDMLLEYVRRGGTVILPRGCPFATLPKARDAQGRLREGRVSGLRRELGINIEFPWTARHPYCTNIAFSADGPAEKDLHYRCARYLTGKWLRPGDTFTPLLWACADTFRMPIAGVYRYGSSLKGAAIVVTEPGIGILAEVSEADQARLIVRAHLIGFAAGYDRIFWYQFISDAAGRDSADLEANYGITCTADGGTPEVKPAYRAYRVLTRLMPPGSSLSALREGSSREPYSVSWTRPDGKRVAAFWMPYGISECAIPGHPETVVDLYGRRSSVPDRLKVSADAVYLVY